MAAAAAVADVDDDNDDVNGVKLQARSASAYSRAWWSLESRG